MMKVLIATTCTPDDRKTSCAVRALAQAGIEVTAGGDQFRGRLFASRYTRKKLLYPHPARHTKAFLNTLAEAVKHAGHDVILPTSDYTVAALVEGRDAVEPPARLPIPPRRAAAFFQDKLETITLARKLGIETPVTYCPENHQRLRELLRNLDRPFIMKPRRSMGGIGFFRFEAGDILPDPFPPATRYTDTVFDFTRPLVQEDIPGHVHDVCALFNRGEPRAVLTQRRIRMYPDGGGAGIYNETTNEPDLKERAIKLLQAAGWHGPAQVEFKRDAQGRPCLMEVNGRLWGTLDLSVAAGVNFPLLACRLAADGDIRPMETYKVGVRFRWPIPYGLLHAVETGRWRRAMGEFFAPRKGTRSDLWFSDPLPWFAEAALAMGSRRWPPRHRTSNRPAYRVDRILNAASKGSRVR